MISVCDIETRPDFSFLGLGYMNDRDYLFFDTMSDFLFFIKDRKGEICYAHNGGRFDFLFFLEVIYSHKKLYKELKDLKLINGSLVSFRLGECLFRDSLAILPKSLDELAQDFGVGKKLEIDYENIEKHDWKGYLKNDCYLLLEVLRRFFDTMFNDWGIQPRITIASTAMGLYWKKFKKWRWLDNRYASLIRKGYIGGRCEIFKFSDKGPLNYYDVNSMYPYVMVKHLYPMGKAIWLEGKHAYNCIEGQQLGFARADMWCPNIHIPVLPIRYRGKTMFFRGHISGTWTLSEIRVALQRGYKFKKLYFAVVYVSVDDIFSDYINDMYSKRISRPNAISYKLFMNSLYGKFAENPVKDQVHVILDNRKSLKGFHPIDPERGLYSKQCERASRWILPIISMHVTSYARIKMLDFLDDNTFYCDTDGFFTKRDFPTSEKLGDLKLEDICYDAKFHYPKFYTYKTKKEKRVVKTKGFSSFDKKNRYNTYKRILRKEKIDLVKIATFKQSISQGLPFGSKHILTRSIQSDYDKREKQGNNSWPWTMRDYERKYHAANRDF